MINPLHNVRGLAQQEVEPDEWDIAMLKEAENDHEEALPFQQAAAELGLSINELRDRSKDE